MSGVIAKFVGKKILNETLQNKFGTEDPYFEQVPATRLDGRPSKKKFKKRKKALPPGISEHDAKVLTKVKRRAYRLDNALCNCCGIQFGWGSVIGLFPAFGDIIDTLLSLMVFRTAMKVEDGLPVTVAIHMLINCGFDFVIGIVPFIGDLADAAFKANTRNAAILEAHLREKGKKALKKSGKPVPDVDPSLGSEFDKIYGDESAEFVSTQPGRQEGMNGRSRTEPMEPDRARTRRDRRGRERGPDLEMGVVGADTAPVRSNGQRRS